MEELSDPGAEGVCGAAEARRGCFSLLGRQEPRFVGQGTFFFFK